MQFIYIENPTPTLNITGENHKYLFKVRRIKKDELVNVRNLKDDFLYTYKISEINKKEAILNLVEKKELPNRPQKFLHLLWCMIDPKNIEKALPSLNEIGVSKISFVYCEYSQKNFKLKLDRIEKILINSCQQCGRSNLMEIEILNSFEEAISKYPDVWGLDFDGEEIKEQEIQRIFIGAEGGFSEKEKFEKKIKLKGFILRSESAACAISSKILL